MNMRQICFVALLLLHLCRDHLAPASAHLTLRVGVIVVAVAVCKALLKDLAEAFVYPMEVYYIACVCVCFYVNEGIFPFNIHLNSYKIHTLCENWNSHVCALVCVCRMLFV